MKKFTLALVLSLVLGLAACSGGGGGSEVEPGLTARRETVSLSDGLRRNMHQAPDDLPMLTVKAEQVTAVEHPALDLVIEYGAAVEVVPTSDSEVRVDYQATLYDATVDNEAGNWTVHIAYVGEYSAYPSAVLHIPDTAYGEVDLKVDHGTVYFSGVFKKGETIRADFANSTVYYTLPTGFAGNLDATFRDGYLELDAEDDFAGSGIALLGAAETGSMRDGFVRRGDDWFFTGESPTGSVRIDFDHSSYLTVK